MEEVVPLVQGIKTNLYKFVFQLFNIPPVVLYDKCMHK